MKIVIFLSLLFGSILISCKEDTSADGNHSQENAVIEKVDDPISLVRKDVKTAPVAAHIEKTDNPLNDWYFSVKLFETPTTFHYLIKLQFEEIRGEDTLKLPNLGVLPEPVIRKGEEQYSCIIGFLDKEKKFREYKKVYVKNNSLKITALKHYAVRGI